VRLNKSRYFANPVYYAFNLGSSVWSVIQTQARTMFATGLGIARV